MKWRVPECEEESIAWLTAQAKKFRSIARELEQARFCIQSLRRALEEKSQNTPT